MRYYDAVIDYEEGSQGGQSSHAIVQVNVIKIRGMHDHIGFLLQITSAGMKDKTCSLDIGRIYEFLPSLFPFFYFYFTPINHETTNTDFHD